MATSIVTYLGNLRTECEYLQSKNTFITDAPTDNNGKGEAFSPTDTVATALASCMITIMGIKAKDLQIDLKGTKAFVTKYMSTDPRRISKIEIQFEVKGVTENKDKKVLERAAKACPVAHSLHPDIEQILSFKFC